MQRRAPAVVAETWASRLDNSTCRGPRCEHDAVYAGWCAPCLHEHAETALARTNALVAAYGPLVHAVRRHIQVIADVAAADERGGFDIYRPFTARAVLNRLEATVGRLAALIAVEDTTRA